MKIKSWILSKLWNREILVPWKLERLRYADKNKSVVGHLPFHLVLLIVRCPNDWERISLLSFCWQKSILFYVCNSIKHFHTTSTHQYCMIQGQIPSLCRVAKFINKETQEQSLKLCHVRSWKHSFLSIASSPPPVWVRPV